MSNHSPINPPDELLDQWCITGKSGNLHNALTIAYRAGADQELEACINFVYDNELCDPDFHNNLRAARRPKPPSLKEQALALLDKAEDPNWDIEDFSIVRQALEALPND